jgi:hypothetical protein
MARVEPDATDVGALPGIIAPMVGTVALMTACVVGAG